MASFLKGNSTGFSLLGLREVIPDQTGVEQWKELLLNTGNDLTSLFNRNDVVPSNSCLLVFIRWNSFDITRHQIT